MTLTVAQLATELARQTTLEAAQADAPAALAAEQAEQAALKVSAEQIASEVAVAKELRDLQASVEQVRLDALCSNAAAALNLGEAS